MRDKLKTQTDAFKIEFSWTRQKLEAPSPMLLPEETRLAEKNRILRLLPDDDFRRLAAHLAKVSLPSGEIIYEAGETIEQVYFPINSIISLVAPIEEGGNVELAIVGKFGMAGIPVCLGVEKMSCRAVVQVAGDAITMSADALKRELRRSPTLETSLLRYANALTTQISQTVVCNRLHTLEQRLSRWLLMIQDRTDTNEMRLTHEFISRMLGARRAGVSETTSALQRAKLISCGRGRITIINRRALKAVTCKCYSFLRKEYDQVFKSR